MRAGATRVAVHQKIPDAASGDSGLFLRARERYLAGDLRSVASIYPSMIQNLYLVVVVAIRLWGVFMVLSGLYVFLLNLLIVHGGGPAVAALLWPIVAGVILWILAKPIARLVTTNA